MSPKPQVLHSPYRWQNEFPFVPGAMVPISSSLIFLSGQTGRDSTGRFPATADVEQQATAAFRNIARLLGESGSSLEHIVKLTYYVTDMTTWPSVAGVRARFFRDYKPPSTVMEVSRLFDTACLIEIDVIAVQA